MMATHRVTYKKSVRARAVAESKGLYTLEIIGDAKKPGAEIGNRVTMQAPADRDDLEAIRDVMLKVLEMRVAKQSRSWRKEQPQ